VRLLGAIPLGEISSTELSVVDGSGDMVGLVIRVQMLVALNYAGR